MSETFCRQYQNCRVRIPSIVISGNSLLTFPAAAWGKDTEKFSFKSTPDSWFCCWFSFLFSFPLDAQHGKSSLQALWRHLFQLITPYHTDHRSCWLLISLMTTLLCGIFSSTHEFIFELNILEYTTEDCEMMYAVKIKWVRYLTRTQEAENFCWSLLWLW